MADFYINADTFDLATSIYVDIALSTLAPDGFYSMDNGYRQQVGGVLVGGITTCDDPIVANNDSYSSVVTVGMNGNNILANDTVNGVPATTGNVQIAQVSSTNANVNINTSNGAVVVNTIVPVGTYSIVYRICQLSNITNCATANISVNVTPLTIQHCYNFDTTCELACGSTGETSYSFGISIGGDDPTSACNQASANTVYCNTSVVSVNSIFYTDSGITTVFDGGFSWYRIYPSPSSVVWMVDTNGVVVSNSSCSTPSPQPPLSDYTFYQVITTDCSNGVCTGVTNNGWIHNLVNNLFNGKYYYNSDNNKSYQITSSPFTYLQYVATGSPPSLQTNQEFSSLMYNSCSCTPIN